MRIRKSITLPEIPNADTNPIAWIKRAAGALRRFRQTLFERDIKIAQAINSMDFEIVTSEPSDAPDYGEPILKAYKSGATWRIYLYTGTADGWKYWNADG